MDLRRIYLSFLQRTKPQAQHRLRCRVSGSDSSPSSPDQQQQLPGYEPLGGWVVPGAAAAAAAPAALMGNGIATKVGSAPSSQQIDTIAKKASRETWMKFKRANFVFPWCAVLVSAAFSQGVRLK